MNKDVIKKLSKNLPAALLEEVIVRLIRKIYVREHIEEEAYYKAEHEVFIKNLIKKNKSKGFNLFFHSLNNSAISVSNSIRGGYQIKNNKAILSRKDSFPKQDSRKNSMRSIYSGNQNDYNNNQKRNSFSINTTNYNKKSFEKKFTFDNINP